ncbi:MAG TPA: FeoB small GTPase domain-containing protein, partial [Chitinophagaceae bacterium]|nr:FeoB small GTPase domain-containing protein [Chitinophagaceae bacterium]
MLHRNKNIALVGNPNSGKSSLFNLLTGLNQKIGNFPGVTVDKKTGKSVLSKNTTVNVIDLPGTY